MRREKTMPKNKVALPRTPALKKLWALCDRDDRKVGEVIEAYLGSKTIYEIALFIEQMGVETIK